jgi:membrane-associated phospholipid phosphatase
LVVNGSISGVTEGPDKPPAESSAASPDGLNARAPGVPAEEPPGEEATPPEQPLREAAPPGSLLRRVLGELEALDVAVYEAVEGTPTPTIDVPLRVLSNAANHAKLYVGISALLFALGGAGGRRAAVTGLAAVATNSLIVNQPMKLLSRRPRPDRGRVRLAEARHTRMPTSTSFPSGHAASGFAFAAGVSEAMPQLGIPLRALATTVAYSRVHAGVHYPGDVVVGALVGMAVGESTVLASRAVRRRLSRRAEAG